MENRIVKGIGLAALFLFVVYVLWSLSELGKSVTATNAKADRTEDRTKKGFGILFKGQNGSHKAARLELEEFREDQHQVNKHLLDRVTKLEGTKELRSPKDDSDHGQTS
jgi:hypothetical protein